ncbi:MAG TPA: protease [Castellaniella sp.]|uniref:protease n=1 Tax=Castellaniella sp. TaxID=1955812 RepID=UPI002F243E64
MTNDENQTTQTTTTTEGAPSTTALNDAPTDGTLLGQNEQQDDTTATPSGEAKPEAKADDKTKLEGAPEKYDFKAPEGSGGFDQQVLDAFSEAAKGLDLSQDKAQQILDKVAPVIQARQLEQIQAVASDWAKTAKADKEFGGDHLTENLAVAKKALDTFGTPELQKLLVDSGLGNHPEIIRAFYRAGKAISEDRFVSSGRANAQAEVNAKRLYPNSNMN